MTDTIKHRSDGSIDTAYYMGIGRRMRGEQAMALLTGKPKEARARRPIFSLVGLSF